MLHAVSVINMKTSKSKESAEMTPSKKKLKQARLPFKLISEVSPAPVTPPSRKRKLSTTSSESVPKIGKITKENEIVEVISDDESNDGQTAVRPEKLPNPFVKLVDTAIKKKQKSKAKKKRNSRKKSEVIENGPVEEIVSADTGNDCEMMEVDEPHNTNEETDGSKTDKQNDKVKTNKETETVNKSVDIVVLEDSNSSLDIKQSDSKFESPDDTSKTQNKVDNTVTKKSEKENSQSDKPDNDKTHEESSEKSDHTNAETPNNKTPEKSKIKIPITPKRSARNKAKSEENNNKGSPSSKLNDSVSSDPTTPKQSRNSSVTKLDESQNESTISGNLTPKQVSTLTY